MKQYIACVLALATIVSSTAVHAQVGGLLRKKAGEVLGKKPEPAKPAPPAPTPETTTAAPAPTPATTAAPAAAAPAPAASGTRAAAPAAKPAGSPLEVASLPVQGAANQVLRGRINERSSGDWDQLPYIPPAATAAAYALSDSAQVALVETVGAALKTLVTSAAYMADH